MPINVFHPEWGGGIPYHGDTLISPENLTNTYNIGVRLKLYMAEILGYFGTKLGFWADSPQNFKTVLFPKTILSPL